MGEDVENMATTTSQLQAKLLALTGGQVDVMADANTFKSSTQILREMAAAWKSMTDIQRASALELMGGKRQANVLSALITNFDTAEKAIEAAAGSSGSALRENEVFLDSFEGRMQLLTNTVQEKWQEALDVDLIKDAIKLATQFVDTIDFKDSSIIDFLGGLTKALSWLMKIFGDNNFGHTIIAFFGARAAQKYGVSDFFKGWTNFFKGVKTEGVDAIAKLRGEITQLDDEISSLTQQANKQSGLFQKNTLQKIDAKSRLRDDKQKTLNKLEKEKQDKMAAMSLSEQEQQTVVDSFDVDKVANKIKGKKLSVAKRTKSLTKQGMTPEQIKEDPKIKKWNKEITDGQEALDQYNQKVKTTDASLKATNQTITQSSVTTNVNSTNTEANSTEQQKNAGARQSNNGAINQQTASVEKQNATLQKNTGFWSNVGASLKNFALQAVQMAGYMAIIQGVLQAFDSILALHERYNKEKEPATYEELRDAFEEISSDLDEEESQLNTLESSLEDVKDQIIEIQSLGSLSFTKQEELENLKKQSAELERQIEMQEILAKNQQIKTNAAALKAAKAYLGESSSANKTITEAAEEGKEKGEEIGGLIGGLLMIVGGGLALAGGAALTATGAGASVGIPLMIGGGALMAGGFAGSTIGGAIGAEKAKSKYEKQQKRQTAINNYATKKAEYESKLENAFLSGDADKYDEIKEEFNNFESMMADNIGGLMDYLNSVDYKTLTDVEKADYEEYQRMVNKYSLANDGSLTNVANSILKYDRYSKTAYDMDKVQSKLKKGEITEEQAAVEIKNLLQGATGLEKEFTDLGISIDDVVKSYVELGTAARDNASLTDSIGKISAVTNAFDSLGNAIKEFREEGTASIGTLESLKEVFGTVDGFEDLYKVLATGEGNLEDAVTNVANAYVGQVGTLTNLTDEELSIMKSRLAALGVLNAEEVLMARQTGQERIDALGLSYAIDLSNYGTAEQAKIAMAQAAGLNIAEIQGDTIEKLENAYGMDLSAYASVEEAKMAIAMERAKAEANADKEALERKWKNKTISYEDYLQGMDDIDNSLDFANRYGVIQDIINNAYKGFKFDFDGQVGIGTDFDEDTINGKASDAFEKSMKYWENRIAASQAKYEQIQNEVDLLEAKGMRAGAEYYRKQIDLEKERKSLLEQQKAEALKYLGTLKEGGDEWWEVASTINSIEGDIDDVTASVQELNDAIGQIRWDNFEEIHERFSNLISDLDDIRSILSSEDMFDDEGNWTKEGVANLATYIQELEIYKNALSDVQAELADFQNGYDGNEDYFATIGIDSEQEYYDKLIELTDEQNEYVKAVKESEKSVVEMYENQIDAVEEYIGELIDGYNDYIDVVKESLDAEKNLYDFKKKVKNQTKDINQLERRIAALSGANDKASVAERRKLEAQLLEAKEGLNDTYYEHSRDQQAQALDDEAQAYEESMNKYIEGLRTMLEEATQDMTTFLMTVTNVVLQNAGSVEDAYTNTGLALDSAIITPWSEAAKAMADYETGALAMMNAWTQAGQNGYFYNFNANATEQLKSPWKAGIDAANSFASSVKSAMNEVSNSVKTNVDNSLTKLNSLTDGIQDTNSKADSSNQTKTTTTTTDKVSTSGLTDSKGGTINTDIERLQAILNKFFSANLTIDGLYGPATTSAVKKMQAKIGDIADGLYTADTFEKLKKYFANLGGSVSSWFKSTGVYIPGGIKKRSSGGGSSTTTVHLNAKGTLSTKQDGWNITDESWIGEEITLAAGKNGQLQYLKKGSAVLPADIAANLVEWGKINPDMIKIGGGANINMISNAVSKPEFNLNFEALVKAERIDEGTLPEVKKFVQQEINNLVKQMNYAIKGIGGR